MKRIAGVLLAVSSVFVFSGCESINSILKNSIFDNNTSYEIPDSGSVSSEINVTSNIISLTTMTVVVDLNHTRFSDLQLSLTSPSGSSVVLSKNRGGENNISSPVWFDDTFEATLEDPGVPSSQSYKPEENLSAFNSKNPNGKWTLKVNDTKAINTGVLKSWYMLISGSKE